MDDDELEVIALAPPPLPPRRHFVFVLAVAALGVLVLATGALAVVTTEHHATDKRPSPAPQISPAFVASTLGIADGRFAIVDDGRLEFVDAHGVVDASSVPSGEVSIAAANGLSLIVVAMRHWYLVEPGRQPLQLPPGNVFARRAGGWWIERSSRVSVLGESDTPTRLPANTTAVADTPAGMVLQDTRNGRVEMWNPMTPRAASRVVVDADAEILGVGGNEVVWRPAANGTAAVHVVDVVHGRTTRIDQPDITNGAEASVAPDGKHILFYDRAAGTVAIVDAQNGAPIVGFGTRMFGTFSPFTTVPGPTGFQPTPFTWSPDGKQLIVLGTLYPVPRITELDTDNGLALTTPSSVDLDQVAALTDFKPS